MKINVDANFYSDSLQLGTDMILHDDAGCFVACQSMVRIGLLKVDKGEALVLVEAMKWATNLGLSRVQFEIDSRHVEEALKSNDIDETQFNDFIVECRALLATQPFLRSLGLVETPTRWLI